MYQQILFGVILGTAAFAQEDIRVIGHSTIPACSRPNTVVSYSGRGINYGHVGASGTTGVIHHLYDICHEFNCEGNEIGIETVVFNGAIRQPKMLRIRAEGQYSGYRERDAMIELLVAAASVGETCLEESPIDRAGNDVAPLRQCEQSNDFNVNVGACNAAGTPSIQRFMHITVVEPESEKDGYCGKIATTLGGFATLMATFPAFAVASAAAAGFLGTISGVCS